MQAGQTSINLASQEIKEVARLLERRPSGLGSRAPDGHSARANSNTGGSSVPSRVIPRVFSTYSEDDGCADGLYTRDL